ncbi:universal stress protein [Halorientalis brevis]|uniref:Universal stress protein n=1 Tax=Halorientalis brevis TaxID=1126241 RepID=A0ABD6CHQ6_9EURY|nr:universal stress protein [Halorientalis brevis]
MYQTILLPTDGSAGAAEAIARALDLARATDATLHALSVVDTGAEPPGVSDANRAEFREKARTRSRAATQTVDEHGQKLGVDVVEAVREGVPHEAIREYADEHDVDLIVMGTQGWTGHERARLGSTTERVITLGDVPIMTVRLDGDVTDLPTGYGMYDHVVIATDGSDEAARAAEPALEIAEHYGADVHVIYVVDTETYDLEDAPRSIVGLLKEGGQKATETIADLARERNLPVDADVLRGRPDEEILAFADGVEADLIVVGTRGLSATTDRLLGSVTARILERAETPVMTR